MATHQETYVRISVPKEYMPIISNALMRIQNVVEFLKPAADGQECCLIAKVNDFGGARCLEDAIVKNISKISGEKTVGSIASAVHVKAII